MIVMMRDVLILLSSHLASNGPAVSVSKRCSSLLTLPSVVSCRDIFKCQVSSTYFKNENHFNPGLGSI